MISETIYVELNILNKKWVVGFTHRPPDSSNKTTLDELTKSLSTEVNSFDDIISTGDFNINVLRNGHFKTFLRLQ